MKNLKLSRPLFLILDAGSLSTNINTNKVLDILKNVISNRQEQY